MNITDLLRGHMTPLFEGEGEGGSGAGAGEGGAGTGEGGAGEGTGEGTGSGEGGTKLTSPDEQNSGEGEGSGEGSGDGSDQSQNSQDGDQGDNTDDSSGEFTVATPEGADEATTQAIETFNGDVKSWLKDNPNATPSDALKWAAERQIAAVNAATEAQSEAFDTQLTEWDTQSRADKEMAGDDGQQFDANLAVAVKAVDKLGTPELKVLLDQSGLGNHPEVIRFAMRAGKSLSDSPVFTGGGNGVDNRSFTERVYPKS